MARLFAGRSIASKDSGNRRGSGGKRLTYYEFCITNFSIMNSAITKERPTWLRFLRSRQ
jgi:hypothetical protein